MHPTMADTFPETLSELLIPTDPALAREMATFHINALLRCLINGLTEKALLAATEELGALLGNVEALLAV